MMRAFGGVGSTIGAIVALWRGSADLRHGVAVRLLVGLLVIASALFWIAGFGAEIGILLLLETWALIGFAFIMTRLERRPDRPMRDRTPLGVTRRRHVMRGVAQVAIAGPLGFAAAIGLAAALATRAPFAEQTRLIGAGLLVPSFTYDPVADAYHCPGGRLLDTRYRSVTYGHVSIQHSSPAACADCTIRARCTGGRWRRINRWENEAVLERMAKRLAARPGILNVRRETVEHSFGSIKQWMNQGAFLMRGLENVRGEFSLTALAYNLRRTITLVGISGLIRAVMA